MTGTVPLATDFRSVDRQEWLAAVAKVLARRRGDLGPEDAERALRTTTEDRFDLLPLYGPDDTTSPPPLPGTGSHVRGAAPPGGQRWRIRARHWVGGPLGSDPAAILDDLHNGVDELWLTVVEPGALAGLLAAVDVGTTAVVLESFGGHEAPRLLLDSTGRVASATSLGLDPLGTQAATGVVPDWAPVLELVHRALASGIRAFTIDGSISHDAGASAAEQLACATAAGVATLRRLVASGVAAAEAERLIEFRFAVTDDQFQGIAALRAARMMWARVTEVAGIPTTAGQQQHAVTSAAMLTQRDPSVNLIRNCVAAFAAGVGGAAAVTVLPHTQALGSVDAFSRRMARNTQHLILEESGVGDVTDPAGGSSYVEARTQQIAAAAWEFFQEIEVCGGLDSALAEGSVVERIERTRLARDASINTRRRAITGVTEFPAPERLQSVPVPWRRPGGYLGQHRYAERFEALRDRADALPEAPTVALLTLGAHAEFGPRQTFAANFFGVGGFDTVDVAVNPDVVLPDGVRTVCLVGTDRAYADQARGVVEAARLAGAERVLLAGRPPADPVPGVDDHLFVGCDALELLTGLLDRIDAVEVAS